MSTVTVVGTGLLGQGIAAVLARRGHAVVLHDTSPSALRRAEEAVRQAAPVGVSVRAVSELELAVEPADVVIEAVLEDLGVKQELFMRVGLANGRAILMSNSSALPIGQIALRTNAPERTVGTHWWNPPQLIPVVEVIRGPSTSDQVLERTTAFLRQLGKRPVQVARDVPGFIGNRLQHALWREALGMLSIGAIDAVSIDRIVALSLGVSLTEQGPLAQMRSLGLERVRGLFAKIGPQLIHERTPAPLLRAKVAAGALGAKSGRGFLIWPAGARESAATRLQQHVQARLQGQRARGAHAPSALSRTEESLANRLQLALWREALALVNDGVCEPQDVDLMACSTIGVRLAAMGPVENADYIGLDLTLAIHEVIFPGLRIDATPPARLP